MFKLFKRSSKTTPTVTPPVVVVAEPPAEAKEEPVVKEPSSSFKERRLVTRPLPLPEVIEGDGGETDWALWEDVKRKQE